MTNLTQGRSPQQHGNNEKSAAFAIMVLAIATLLALAVNKCDAQTYGYRYCISDSAGFRCHNTLNITEALDSLTIASGLPAAHFTTQLTVSPYVLNDNQAFTVYIEKKLFVKTRKNGKLKLRRVK